MPRRGKVAEGISFATERRRDAQLRISFYFMFVVNAAPLGHRLAAGSELDTLAARVRFPHAPVRGRLLVTLRRDRVV